MNPLGLHAAFARTLPLPERFVFLKDAGFDATALWWEERNAEIRAIRHRAPDLVRQHGLFLDHLHVPYYACNDLWRNADTVRREAIDLHKSWIADCQRHAVPRMVMHVTRGRAVAAPSPHALDAFRELTAAAEDAGVTLALENTHCPAHLDFLFRHIDSPAVALCFDIAHDRLHSPAPLQLLRAWASRTSVLHISDTDGRRDWHWLPGAGNTDYAESAACFPAPFDGPLMLEAMLRGAELPARFALRAHAAARALQALFQPEKADPTHA